MNLTDLYHSVPGHKKRKRVGRGQGSGSGGTCGRGHKGQMARAGTRRRNAAFEGGQMPLFRRLAKRGFKNALFKKEFVVLNLSQLATMFGDGAEILIDSYKSNGIVKNYLDGVKILGDGDAPKNLKITAHRFSGSARQKIEAAGGTCTELAPAPTHEELAARKPVRRGGKKKAENQKQKSKPAAEAEAPAE